MDKVVEHAYDYQNRWVRKRLDGDGDGHTDQRRLFACDGNQIVMDFWRANSGDLQIGHLRERYLWGPAVDQILAEEEVDGGTADLVAWTLTDHLNTVRDIAKYDPQTGTTTVVNHLVYDAFGNVTSESNPAVDSLFLFTARPFDGDTGLQNNLNRWYDPRVGRWLSEDPLGFDAGDLNLYRYVGNLPVYRTDPFGLKPLGQKWDVLDFFWWYYFGFGREVPLDQIGLLLPWWAAIKPQVLLRLKLKMVPSLESQLSCEHEDSPSAEISVKPFTIPVAAGGAITDPLTVMGNSIVKVRGTCKVTLQCKQCCAGERVVSGSSGSCDLDFFVRDKFQNPLDWGGPFGKEDWPGATPYDLVASWSYTYTWKNTYDNPCPEDQWKSK